MIPIIACEGLSLARGARVILRDLDLDIGRGETIALVGPSGCGKTTLLRLILGFESPGSGRISIGGRLATAGRRILLAPEERGLGIVFQDLALWPHLTVRGNLEFVLAARRVPRPERASRISTWVARTGLVGKEDAYPGELSGGERQRVALARALVLEPRALLLDEPLSNLDVGLKREILGLLRSLLRDQDIATLVVTHDLREAVALGASIAVMAEGRIVQQGRAEELRAHPLTGLVRQLTDGLTWDGAIDE